MYLQNYGERFSFQSLSINRLFNYSCCMNVWISDQGIILKPMWLFSYKHSPIFLPWQVIRLVKVKKGNLKSLLLMVPSKKLILHGGSVMAIGEILPHSVKVTESNNNKEFYIDSLN
jgi:hypothetical protein